MARPLVLVSGFGPFEAFERNPSGELARALALDPPEGVRIRAVVLPVSFARAPGVLDAALAPRERPALCLGLGVATRRRVLSLERFASSRLKRVPRPDVDGRSAREFTRPGPLLETPLALERLRARLRRRGSPPLRISVSAGGYVCEHFYRHLLARAAERGVPALFLHVLPERRLSFARQLRFVRRLIEEALRAPLPNGSSINPRARGADTRPPRRGSKRRSRTPRRGSE